MENGKHFPGIFCNLAGNVVIPLKEKHKNDGKSVLNVNVFSGKNTFFPALGPGYNTSSSSELGNLVAVIVKESLVRPASTLL